LESENKTTQYAKLQTIERIPYVHIPITAVTFVIRGETQKSVGRSAISTLLMIVGNQGLTKGQQ